ncbi:MAG: molybdopterin molybdotransferase MoeA [Lachnospiraceae bacterium]|nr:molybdopterin molybdotransferase MoeA [Lachnospiraceae bacterium]
MSVKYREALELLADRACTAGTEEVDLKESFGRILATDITAKEDVPSFERSPYDGYAFRAEDTKDATEKYPVTLKVIENIRAGQAPARKVTSGTAIRLMTGAPVPEGADAVCKYEDTDFTDEYVTLRQSFRPGQNIVRAGEDIKRSAPVANSGFPVDAGMAGVLASLGQRSVTVYKIPVAGIITTGDEITEEEGDLPFGKIRNSNRYSIAAALEHIGMKAVYLGHAKDEIDSICDLIKKGEQSCDVIISTGGVSVGDYDLVPDAMEKSGYDIIVRGVAMKPGMACAYGVKDGRLMLGLSGNPASALTNLQCVCYPALRKIMGHRSFDHSIAHFKLAEDVQKAGGGAERFARGHSRFCDGELCLDVPGAQGNIVISSAVGCDAYGILTGMSAPVKKGTIVSGFFV